VEIYVVLVAFLARVIVISGSFALSKIAKRRHGILSKIAKRRHGIPLRCCPDSQDVRLSTQLVPSALERVPLEIA
jgi:hypothetical protein